VIGLGDQGKEGLPELARQHLAHHLQVRSLWDEVAVVREVQRFAARCASTASSACGSRGCCSPRGCARRSACPGMTVAETLPFRDKELMKQRLDAAGIRTPRHARGVTADEVREAAERIGYPVIVKPIAGAGSADTHRSTPAELERALRLLQHVPEVSVEEFIEAEEFTFDTICAGGRLEFENVCWYKPQPLQQRSSSG
jgi:hypothetical protein